MDDENKSAKQLEIEREIKELREAQNNLSDEAAASLQVAITLKEKDLKLAQEASEILRQQQQELQANIDLLQEKIDQEEDENVKLDLQNKLRELNVEKIKKQIEQDRQKGKLSDEELKKQLKEIENQKEVVKSNDKQIEQLEKKASLGLRILEGTKEVVGRVNQLTGGITTSFFSMMTFEGFLNKLGNMVREVNEAQAELAGTTGQVGLAAGGASVAFGLSVKDMSKATGTLFTEMSSFSHLNKATQGELVSSAARMTRLGVSTNDYGKSLNNLTQATKLSAKESNAAIEGIAKSAMGMGVAPSVAIKNFSSAFPQLAANGKNVVSVFTELQKQSKGLGMELGELLGIANKFDTFEDAANNAGKLNAVLGGDYLNSVDMLNASEEERIKMMREAFAASGKSFDNMDRFEQKAIAASLGLKDVSEAQKLFGTMSKENEKAVSSEAKTQKDLLAAQSAATTAAQKLEQAMTAFLPVAQEISSALNKVVNAFAGLPPTMQMLIILMPIIIAFFIKLKVAMADKAEASQKLSKSSGGAAKSIRSIGEAGAKAWPSILAIGGAMLLAGVGIAIAAYGLSKLVLAFKELNPDQLKAAIIAITVVMLGFVAMIGILGAVMAAGPGLYAVLGMLAMGVAAILLAAALNLALDPILALMQALNNSPNILRALVIAFKILADSVVTIAQAIIGGLLEALRILMPFIERMFTFALPLLVDAFKFVIPIIKEIIQIVVETLVPALVELARIVMDVLLEAFKFIVPPLERLITIIANGLFVAIQTILPIVDKLATIIINGLLNAVMLIIPAVERLATLVIGGLFEGFNKFMGLIERLAEIIVGGFVKGLSLVKDILELITSKSAFELGEIALKLGAITTQLAKMFALGADPNLSAFTTQLTTIFNTLSGKIENNLVKEIKNLQEALMSIPEEVNTKISQVREVKEMIRFVADTGPRLQPATDFLHASKEFYDAQKDSKDAAQDSLVQAIKAAMGSVVVEAQSSGGFNPNQPIIIRIDDATQIFGHVWSANASGFTNGENE